MIRVNFVRLLAVFACAALVVTGCAAIPTSGPVGTSAPDNTRPDAIDYAFDPAGPEEDAEPEDIISGFITAGLSPADDYDTARQFLAPQLSRSWLATARTFVYEDRPNIASNVGAGSYSLEFAIVAEIDAFGRMTRHEQPRIETVEVTLQEIDGQWRIADLPDGTMVEESDFDAVFASYPLYFYDPTYTYAVPDYRWYATRQSLAATLVTALLAGPSPYLENAVVNAFPEGSALARNSVPVEAQQATVDLTEQVFEDAPDLRRQRMKQQLELTLRGINRISSVVMTLNQTPVSIGDQSGEFRTVSAAPSVGDTQIAIADDQLVFYQGGGVLAIGNLQDISAYGPRDPAMSPAGQDYDNQYSFLNRDRTQMVMVVGGEAEPAVTGQRLVRPSIDVHGWHWTVDSATGEVTVVRAPVDGTVHDKASRTIASDWLDDLTVTSFRVSLDGTRAVVVTNDGAESEVLIVGLVRDSNGVPRGFTEPVALQASVPASKAVWDSASSVIVYDESDDESVSAERLDLDGGSDLFTPLLGMTNFASGPGNRIIYAETPDGVYSRVSSVWKKQDGEASDLAYPG
ncbi:sporulation and spore germination protein [Zhihengliuella halotolerans]|uniref:Sporulation and spore germination protein n=1 Tax=Zhihengliuella halotolerans TaxID=370736 RepID=A0A4Q8AAI5_9MICC|nr:sporulation and spore germination protein [Zhihengliuella halotolerans]